MILILGSSGFVGSALLEKLSKKKKCIVILRNKTKEKKNIIYFYSKKINKKILTKVFKHKISTIFNCAGEIKNEEKMPEIHIKMINRFLNFLLKKKTKKKINWIQLSSAGVYGPPKYPDERRVLDETYKNLQPFNKYEITKKISEDIITNLKFKDKINYSILRPSQIIAKNMPNESIKNFVYCIEKKIFFYIGKKDYTRQYIHLDDVVRALITIEKKILNKSNQQIYNLSYDCNLRKIVNQIIKIKKIKFNPITVPVIMARIIVFFGNLFSIRFPLTNERIDGLISRTKYSSKKIKKNLDFKFSKNPINEIASFYD